MSSIDRPPLHSEFRDGVQVIRIGEDWLISEPMVNELGEALVELVGQTEHPRMLLDFGNVGHVGSALLSKLISLQRKVKDARGLFALCSIAPETFLAFRVCKLDVYFQIYPGIEEAIEHMKDQPPTSDASQP